MSIDPFAVCLFMLLQPLPFCRLIGHMLRHRKHSYNLFIFNFRFLCWCPTCEVEFCNELTEAEYAALREDDED